jgi:hypothetical protein
VSRLPEIERKIKRCEKGAGKVMPFITVVQLYSCLCTGYSCPAGLIRIDVQYYFLTYNCPEKDYCGNAELTDAAVLLCYRCSVTNGCSCYPGLTMIYHFLWRS